MKRPSLILAAVATLTSTACAEETEQKYGYDPKSFEIKYYVQTRYSLDIDTENAVDNSFSVRRSRLYLTSTVAPRITGRVEMEMRPQGVETLEAWFQYSGTQGQLPGFSARGGQVKKPFSYQEYGMSSSSLNLIDRPASNGFLEKQLNVSAYDQGITLAADLSEHDIPAMLTAGVYNGNGGGTKSDDNSGKEFVARADVTPVTGLSFGGNIAVNGIGVGESSDSYTVWGGDLRFAKTGFDFLGEVFGGDNYTNRLTSTSAAVPMFLGVYGEVIYRIDGWEPAARVEQFDPDTDSAEDSSLILTGQIARSFSDNFRWQINVVHTRPERDGTDTETQVLSQWTVRL